ARVKELERKNEHFRLFTKAEKELARNNYAEAEKLYTQALDLIPNDADTIKGLVETRTRALAVQKAEEEGKKRKLEVDRLVEEGKKAVADKKYGDAIKSLESARSIDPTDKGAREALDEARTLLAK